jgi:hypothetical protein
MGLPLIPVQTTGTYRWFIVLLTALASGLLTGIIFGFVPLQNVMILEGMPPIKRFPSVLLPKKTLQVIFRHFNRHLCGRMCAWRGCPL